MSWLTDKLEEIKTALESVSGLDNIYKRDSWTVDPKEFRKLFTEAIKGRKRRVNTWMIGRESFREAKDLQIRYIKAHTFVIRGFLSFNEEDDSWTEFQGLVDAICDRFRGDQTIWNSCSEEVEEAVQARLIGYEFFGEVFSHYCELVLEIEEHNIKDT